MTSLLSHVFNLRITFTSPQVGVFVYVYVVSSLNLEHVIFLPSVLRQSRRQCLRLIESYDIKWSCLIAQLFIRKMSYKEKRFHCNTAESRPFVPWKAISDKKFSLVPAFYSHFTWMGERYGMRAVHHICAIAFFRKEFILATRLITKLF